MARRRKVLGLPIGRKRPRIPSKALVAAGAGIVGLPAAVAASRRLPGAVSSGADRVHRVQDAVASGTDKVRQISDIAEKAEKAKEAADQHSTKIGKVGAIVSQLSKMGGSGDHPPKLSHLIEEHTEVAVPRTETYNQWTQFEMFPSIVKGAEQVEQIERDKVKWSSKIGPSRRSWTTEITEQIPDERISWKSTGGLQMKGVVTFHSLDEDLTRVLVQIEYDPSGPVEQVGNLLRIQRRRVRRDLRLFKHFVELRGQATGAWRSRIAKKDDRSAGSDAQTRNGTARHAGPRAPGKRSNGKRSTSTGRASGNGRADTHKRASASTRKSPSRASGSSAKSRSRQSS
jgi:hypothetical protein